MASPYIKMYYHGQSLSQDILSWSAPISRHTIMASPYLKIYCHGQLLSYLCIQCSIHKSSFPGVNLVLTKLAQRFSGFREASRIQNKSCLSLIFKLALYLPLVHCYHSALQTKNKLFLVPSPLDLSSPQYVLSCVSK